MSVPFRVTFPLYTKIKRMITAQQRIYVLLFGLLPEAIIETMLIPLAPFLIRHLFRDSEDVQLGYYVGLFGSAFYLPLFIMNAFWGYYSDKAGRRPVVILGILFSAISVMILCTTQSFWIAFFARFLAGVFGANSTVVKGFIGDLTKHDLKAQSWGYAMYGAVYGFSGIIGPMIGGFLPDPSKATLPKNPTLYQEFMFAYPYFWVGSCLSLFGWIALWVTIRYVHDTPSIIPHEELKLDDVSLSKNSLSKKSDNSIAEEDVHPSDHLIPKDLESPIYPGSISQAISPQKKFFGLPSTSVLPMILYSLIALAGMMFMTCLPLLFASPLPYGLQFSSSKTSGIMTIVSVSKFIFQITLFAYFIEKWGIKRSYRYSMIMLVPALVALGYTTSMKGLSQWISLLFSLLLMGFAEALAYLGAIMLITQSVHHSMLGFIHGIACTFAAGMRTIGPSLAGNLWDVGVHYNITWLCPVFVAGVCALAAGLSFKLP